LRIILKFYGSEEEEFRENISLQYGCVFSLEQIGEHVKRLSPEIKKEHTDVDWKNIAGMRDFIAHNYFNVNISRVRYAVLKGVPPLADVCRSIINRLP
jgi:uncharacterized protein with HEPN domain